MGMYTTLYFKARIKKEYTDLIENYGLDGEWKDCGHPLLEQFGNGDRRASFIPNGAVDYNCVKGSGRINEWLPQFRLWEVQCSLKNYDATIDDFLDIFADMIDNLYECVMIVEERGGDVMYDMHLIEVDPQEPYAVGGRVVRKEKGSRIVIKEVSSYHG